MRKKTFIVLSSVVFTIILVAILGYRVYLLSTDTSGYYSLQSNDWLVWSLTFLPEISIITTIIAIYAKKRAGLVFTGLSGVLIICAFIAELITKGIKLVDGVVPTPCVPWLNIPVFIIAVILFVIKFRIYSLPNEIKIKLKIVNLC